MAYAAKRFAHQALDPIAFHRSLGNAFGNCQTKSGMPKLVLAIAHRKTAAAEAAAGITQCSEVTGAAEPRLARQAGGTHRYAPLTGLGACDPWRDVR